VDAGTEGRNVGVNDAETAKHTVLYDLERSVRNHSLTNRHTGSRLSGFRSHLTNLVPAYWLHSSDIHRCHLSCPW
jgi:hypothetical protein